MPIVWFANCVYQRTFFSQEGKDTLFVLQALPTTFGFSIESFEQSGCAE